MRSARGTEGTSADDISIARITVSEIDSTNLGLEIVVENSRSEVAWIEGVRLFGSAEQSPAFHADPFLIRRTYEVNLTCGMGDMRNGTNLLAMVRPDDDPIWAYEAIGQFKYEFGTSVGRSWKYNLDVPVLLSTPPMGRSAVRLVFREPDKRLVEEIDRRGELRGMYVSHTDVNCGLEVRFDKGTVLRKEMSDSLLHFIANSGKEVEAQSLEEKERSIKKESRVLFLSADPSDASRLRLGEEMREIREKLQLSKNREDFRLEIRTSTRVPDLTQALLDVEPNYVHFSGHGSATDGLCLETQLGRTQYVTAEALGALFQNLSEGIECVVLNACYSEAQAKEIAKHVPWVIGMSSAIPDNAAIAFSVGFYQALGAGKEPSIAFKLGCTQIQLLGIPEEHTPILLKGRLPA